VVGRGVASGNWLPGASSEQHRQLRPLIGYFKQTHFWTISGGYLGLIRAGDSGSDFAAAIG
jgi:hypothetical protein